MYWANFLHFYQPPTQTKRILKKVANESYRRIIAELKRAPQAKVTLNITGCLTELLVENGFLDVIEDLRELARRGQIELTGSAKYHPLLPKLPKEEIVRQIQLDLETNRKYFGDVFQPRGFFPPEAAYNRELAQIVADLGFEWILVEELSYNGQFGAVKYNKCYEIEGIYVRKTRKTQRIRESENQNVRESDLSGSPAHRSSDTPSPSEFSGSPLKIFFRERNTSFKILSGQLGTIRLFEEHLGERITRNEYLLTAMDGETFGHHRPGMEKLLFEIYQSPRIKTALISQLPGLFPSREVVKTLPSTWALMEKDIERKAPFSRWEDPGNEIHRLQWQLTELAIKTVRESRYSSENSENSVSQRIRESERQSVRKSDLSDTPRHRNTDTPSRSEFSGNPDEEQKQWLKARQMLDRSLHSDQFWWASARPWWSLEMIERGANELKNVVLTVPDAPKRPTLNAKRLYNQIITTGFEWQRSGKVEEIARREDEEIRERADVGMPKLPKAEVEKMISNLKREMLEVAEKQEYERAAQLRDRIRELEEYKRK